MQCCIADTQTAELSNALLHHVLHVPFVFSTKSIARMLEQPACRTSLHVKA